MEKDRSQPVQTDMRYVGRLIRVWRAELGMTQRDVADRLGISAQQFQKYESGISGIELSRLFDICRVFGKSPSDLLNADPSQRTAQPRDSAKAGVQDSTRLPDNQINESITLVQADISFQISEVVSEFLAIKTHEDKAMALNILRCISRRA